MLGFLMHIPGVIFPAFLRQEKCQSSAKKQARRGQSVLLPKGSRQVSSTQLIHDGKASGRIEHN